MATTKQQRDIEALTRQIEDSFNTLGLTGSQAFKDFQQIQSGTENLFASETNAPRISARNVETPQNNFTPPLTPVEDVPFPKITEAIEARDSFKENTFDPIDDEIAELRGDINQVERFRGKQEDKQKLGQLRETQTDLTNQLLQLESQSQIEPLQTKEEFAGRGVTKAGVNPISRARQNSIAIDALTTNALLQATNNQIGTALASVDRAVEAKYAPKIAELEDKLRQRAEFEEDLTDFEKKIKSAEDERDKAELANLKQAKQDDSDKRKIALELARNGVNSLVLNSVINSPTLEEAIITASPFLSKKSSSGGSSASGSKPLSVWEINTLRGQGFDAKPGDTLDDLKQKTQGPSQSPLGIDDVPASANTSEKNAGFFSSIFNAVTSVPKAIGNFFGGGSDPQQEAIDKLEALKAL